MRRVLVLAYHFPPIGGAGVQRSAKFVRYLPEFGYEPVVVTGPGTPHGRWSPMDDSLVAEVPQATTVLRLSTAAPPSSGLWRSRGERWLGLTEPFFTWWERGATELGLSQEVDVVYASMSPFQSGAAAAEIARRTGRPWVADLRDPWALDEMQVYASRLHRRLDLRRMRANLATAAAVVVNTEEAARLVAGFPELAGKPVVAVPNGFDPEDFAGAAPARADDAFRIAHAGYLHSDLGEESPLRRRVRGLLGGASPGVDILTRSHVFLLEALDRLAAAHPELASQVELQLAGVLSERDLAVAARSTVVRAHGYLPHDETIALLRSADLLFLPMHDLPTGERARIVPGKTYEYLATGRPILAAVPDGDARDLLTRAGTASLCRPRDAAGMAEALARAIERKRSGAAPPALADGVLEPYERRNLTRRLAEVLDAVAGMPPGRSRARSAALER